MRFLFEHKKKLMVLVVILPAVLLVGYVTYEGWRLASPSRKAVEDYHRDWLDQPERHGVSIEETICLGGKVPVLVLEPRLPLGERGMKIREQLLAKGVAIPTEGEIAARKASHTVVLLHGRNGRKEDLLAVAERFCAVGLRCLLLDLPAHGDSVVETVQFGASEWEQDVPYRVLLECAEKYDFSSKNASLWGMSMGGSFANSALADEEHGSHWRCAVIVCSFDRLDEVIRGQCNSDMLTDYVSNLSEYYGGARLSDVSPADWVKNVQTPVMMVHGSEDSLISIERGQALYASYASTDKRWVDVDGGTHQNILVTPMPLYAEMLEWILLH